MSTTQWLLLGHLVSAFVFFAGGVSAGVLQLAAMRARRPSEVALLLGLIRPVVIMVGAGALATLGFGLALASHLQLPDGLLWVRLAVYLWIASVVAGAIGGRQGRHARQLAQRLAADDDTPSPELAARVADPVSVGLSGLSFLLVVAILVLMVWQPA